MATGVSAATQTCGRYCPKKALQLLDPVDDRQHDPAGPLAGEPGRPQFGDLIVEASAELLLHAAGRAMRDHRAGMIEKPA